MYLKPAKTGAVLFASVLITAAAYTSADACTGIYIGKDVSVDGSVMLARTEDMSSSCSKRFIVHQAADHEPGEYYTDSYGLKVEYPEHTYRYTAVPCSAHKGIGDTPYGEAGFNECGVAATSTITAYPNDAALKADPFTENGLYELSVNDIILSFASSAREGIEIIADIVDEHGSGEGNIIMIADKDEAWYMEILSGHQYAAIKLPDDKAAVIPNAYMLETIDVNSNDTIVSDGLVTLARDNGFLKEENGKINIRDTYSVPVFGNDADPADVYESNLIRVWGGRRLLGGGVSVDPHKGDYSLLFTPNKKISVKDVMDVTRYRYEDTEYNTNLEENKFTRMIGTSRQEECHILQIRPNLSVQTSCVEWLCYGNSEFAPFIPYYAAALTETPPICAIDSPDYSEYSIYWSMRSLSTICSLDRELFGNAVKEFYSRYEDALIEHIKQADNGMTTSTDKAAFANKECALLSYDAFNKSRELYKQLIKFLAEYEGRNEFKDNVDGFVFEPDLSVEIDRDAAYVTTLPTVITVD